MGLRGLAGGQFRPLSENDILTVHDGAAGRCPGAVGIKALQVSGVEDDAQGLIFRQIGRGCKPYKASGENS